MPEIRELEDFKNRMILRYCQKAEEEGESWRSASLSDLWDRLIRNVNELGHDIFRQKTDQDDLLMQAADCGNMVWMLTERIIQGYEPK